MLFLTAGTPCAERDCGVAIFHILPWHEHVTGGTAGVGAFAFLHNHYRVLRVEVHKVNPEVGTC